MTAPLAEWHLPSRRLGRRVLVFDQLESTNSHAAALAADPGNDGLIVLAREQTAGRGQHGRSWQCPAGAGVLTSVLLFPPPPLRRPALLTAWAAVSVCETIRQAANVQAKIKWPNDVLIRGRKVCGILIEQGQGTVVGIGLNVSQNAEAFARAGLPVAGSLACFTNVPLDCTEVFRTLVGQLDEGYESLCQGDWAALEAGWKWRLGLLGKQVTAECLDGVRVGRLCDLTFERLELELPGGQRFRAAPESVRHLEPAGGRQ
jgi:BirA family biotin operon repressor/biotin-[acetyl-CoA-carboxylase] ligase